MSVDEENLDVYNSYKYALLRHCQVICMQVPTN